MIYDINHLVGNDIQVSPSGDLSLSGGPAVTQQRILRRLMTNPAKNDDSGNVQMVGDYPFHQDFGAGVGGMVGGNVDVSEIVTLIRGQMLMEDSVAPVPAPLVTVTPIDVGILAELAYNDAKTNSQQFLSFDINI